MFSLRFYIWFILLFLLFSSMLLITAVAAILWAKGIQIEGHGAPGMREIITMLNPVFYYILFNSVIFSFAGTILLSGKMIRPVEKMIKQAERFKGKAEKLFLPDSSSRGMGKLSRAMNNLITRLEQDHEKLEKTVKELKEANKALEETQKEMVRAEKLASIGRLTAGLAHEIGNPLGILSGYMTLLEEPYMEVKERDEVLKRAKTELERIDSLIRRLLSFAKPQAGKVQPCSLKGIVTECVNDLRLQPMFKGIKIREEKRAREDTVMADPLQIRQVILNCMVNSADAVRSVKTGIEGCITVSTETVNHDENGQMIRLEIKDNGIGMEKENIQSVFDPFFTTKEIGKGTGLGLSVSYMIIKGLKGRIEITSERGDGCTVSIWLPLRKPEIKQT